MRIGELARATGLSASRIRFYEEHGVIPPAVRRDNGYRDYSASAVEMLRFIDGAQALGFTLAELGAVFTNSADMPDRADMIAALERKHDELGRHIRAATAKRKQIAEVLADLRSCEDPAQGDDGKSS